MTSVVFGSGPHTWMFPPTWCPTHPTEQIIISSPEGHQESYQSYGYTQRCIIESLKVNSKGGRRREANVCFLALLNYPLASCVHQVKKKLHVVTYGVQINHLVKKKTPSTSHLNNVTKVYTKID